MRKETEYLLDDIEVLYPGPEYKGHRELIKEYIKKPEVKYEYFDELAKRPGESEQIIQELSQSYNISPDTVKKYAYKV